MRIRDDVLIALPQMYTQWHRVDFSKSAESTKTLIRAQNDFSIIFTMGINLFEGRVAVVRRVTGPPMLWSSVECRREVDSRSILLTHELVPIPRPSST